MRIHVALLPLAAGIFAVAQTTAGAGAGPGAAGTSGFRARPPEDEVVYFLLPDRFESGDSCNGSEPASRGWRIRQRR